MPCNCLSNLLQNMPKIFFTVLTFQIFVSVSLFNLIRIPLTLLPWAVIDTIKLVVSINRIQAFLNAEELNDECVGTNLQNSSENSIEIRNASFSWNSEKRRTSGCGQIIGKLFFSSNIFKQSSLGIFNGSCTGHVNKYLYTI